MAILVIGCVTRDTLIFPRLSWQIQENLGGILYTISSLTALTSKTIRPVCNVGYDIFNEVKTSLKRFPHVYTSSLRKIDKPNVHCSILFSSEYGTQYDEGTAIPITFSQVKPFLADCTFILVSQMTGFDLELRTLQQIKQSAKCPVYLDYHLLALGRDPLGNRYLHRRRNWQNWCTCCDHLQLNQFEAESLSLFPINSELEIVRFAEPILNRGVKSVAITLGDNGTLACWKDEETGIQVMKIDVATVSAVVDTTGCGDVFAAGFIVHFLRTRDFPTSYKFANKVAGLKCGFHGFDSLANVLSLDPINSNIRTR